VLRVFNQRPPAGTICTYKIPTRSVMVPSAPIWYRPCRLSPTRLFKKKWYCVTHYRMQLEKQP
jgi:hypothetical protein